MIDLRSDTVTLPTPEMRSAMAAAEVGDDVYGEDPTVRRLQEASAAATGKEAALFVPSGTMGNLIAVKAHTQPGDEAVCERHAHVVMFEMGGMAWLSGVLPVPLDGRRGVLDPREVARNVHTDVPYYRARTGVICLENTHNYAGGTVTPLPVLEAIGAIGRERGVPVHMDGARLFNAAAACGVPAAAICAHVDSLMFAFSKGLSAPAGSVVCGTREFIERCQRVRRVVGGGMRQVGVLAAAALLGLETMAGRLAEDHAHARRLAEGVAELPGVEIDLDSVQTNIVIFRLRGGAEACRRWVAEARQQGVLCSQMSDDTVRLVTHRHIGDSEVERALAVFSGVASAE